MVMPRLAVREDMETLLRRRWLYACRKAGDTADHQVALEAWTLGNFLHVRIFIRSAGISYVHALAASAVLIFRGTGIANILPVPHRTRKNRSGPASGRFTSINSPISGSSSLLIVLPFSSSRIRDHPTISQAARLCSTFCCPSALLADNDALS